MLRRLRRIGVLSLLVMAACGSEGSTRDPESGAPGDPEGPSGGVPSPPPRGTSTETPPPGPGPAAESSIVGLWEVSGTDARGDYRGEIEIRSEGTEYRFIRAVRYLGVTVEDGRELHWLFRGKLTKSGTSVKLASSLKRADFVLARGSLVRSKTDTPLDVSGNLTVSPTGNEIQGTIGATGIALTDTWRAKKALPATPIFVDERTIFAAHDPPPPATKALNFALYADYHGLDIVAPYVGRPEFQAAVHHHVVDPTDLAFYRANKDALRVVDKVVDEISLTETRARADAYRYTLREKAERYAQDIEQRFLDPSVGMLPDGGPSGTALGAWPPSGDGALWTGVYLASQVYRFQVTGEQKAKDNVVIALDALLKLQEITFDWTRFARTLRKASGTPPAPPWRAGFGPYANLEWLEGGNNDMLKGLFYGYLMGWELLCEGGATGHEALCARIRTNTKHLADDVKLEGGNAPASQLSNQLPAAWLYAIFTNNIGDRITYTAKANAYWAVVKPIMAQTPVSYSQGIVDFSGQHLSSIGDMVTYFAAKRLNLGGDALASFQASIDASHKNLARQRFPNWHLLEAAFGSVASPTSPFIDVAVSRMVEAKYPKTSYWIDHRLSPEFCMSPYPLQPWKNDWMTYPLIDRTQGLDSYPLFEMHPDIMYWKTGNGYFGYEGYEAPGGDFLHLYWFARKYGLISASK